MLSTLKRNKFNRIFINGSHTPLEVIVEIKENYSKTGSIAEASKLSRVDYKTAKKYIFQEDIVKESLPTPKDHFIQNLLYTLLTAHPSIHLNEIRLILIDCFDIERSCPTICRWINELGFTRKRVTQLERRRKSERVIQLRINLKSLVRTMDCTLFVFLDETHISYDDLSRKYGYSLPGQPVITYDHKLCNVSYTLMLAINSFGIVYYKIIKTSKVGATTSTDFLEFLEVLQTRVSNNAIIFLDNAPIHREKNVERWLDTNHPRYLLNAPYSPDLNPIEIVFSIIKSHLKNYCHSQYNLSDIIIHILEKEINEKIIQDCIKHVIKNWWKNEEKDDEYIWTN